MSNQNFSRRNFIGLTGLAGAGMVLSSNPLMAAQTLRMEETKAAAKFKIGIIGCGNRSKAIIGALNNVPELEMAALCDIVPHKMGQRAQLIKTGVKPKFVNSLDELLKMKELDAIFVITPNDTHRDILIACFEAGKHVWCEKPLAMTVAECNDILEAATRTGKLLQVGNQRRHSPAYKTLIDVVRNKPLGQVLQSDLFDYRGDWRVPDADEYPVGVQYWRMNQRQSGGVVYEMGAHIIDVNNWVMDSEPVSVFSLQGVNNFTLRKRDSSDHAGVLVQFANGAMMNYGGNVYNYGARAHDTWFFEKGCVQMGDGKVFVKYGSPNHLPKPADMPQNEDIEIKDVNREGDGATEQLRHFIKVLEGKEKPYPDGIIGRRCVQVMEGANRSAVARRAIDVKELG
jgi:predicted dehydrogenase